MDNNKTVLERQAKDKATLLETLKEIPIIQIVCKKTGISRATYYRWQQEDKDFKRKSRDSLDQGIEFINDMSESQLITLIREKKMPAIAMWLKNNHKRYGFKGREYTPVATNEDLTPEEEKMMFEALAMASGKSYGQKHNIRIFRKGLEQ
jgi:predicted site-specific integrase-resolvase